MSTSRRVKIDPGASRHARPYHLGMIRGGTLVLALLLGCSASGGEIGAPSGSDSGGGEPGAGGLGESGAPSEPTSGTGGTAGSTSPDLCQAGDERLCSCAPGYGGKQTCSAFGWNLCVCPDWPPDSTGGAGGSGGTGGSSAGSGGSPGVGLGAACTTGTDDCAGLVTPAFATPICVQADGLEGGEPRTGHCTWACFGASMPCEERGGECKPVGELIPHCVVWATP
jgi:hypothetical protein